MAFQDKYGNCGVEKVYVYCNSQQFTPCFYEPFFCLNDYSIIILIMEKKIIKQKINTN